MLFGLALSELVNARSIEIGIKAVKSKVIVEVCMGCTFRLDGTRQEVDGKVKVKLKPKPG